MNQADRDRFIEGLMALQPGRLYSPALVRSMLELVYHKGALDEANLVARMFNQAHQSTEGTGT